MTMPPEARSKYITPQGAARLQEELRTLWRTERPQVTAEVQAAAAQGDRSENAEYIYGKRRLRQIDSRIRFLTKRIEELEVVRAPVADDGRAYFGSWVTVEDPEGNEARFRLVGPDESDVEHGLISVDSPIGRNLLGRREDDEVTIRRPKGDITYLIVAIESDGA